MIICKYGFRFTPVMKKSTIFVSISILVLLGLFYVVSGFSEKSSPADISKISTKPPVEETTFNDQVSDDTNYPNYTEENLRSVLDNYETVVLFFHADWCPTCRALDKELIENSDSLETEQVAVVKVNYDTEKDLKKKYNVTLQHTMVLVDKDQNEITKWIGGDLETLKSQLEI